eukprot:1888424-Amphidinium_carterae.2
MQLLQLLHLLCGHEAQGRPIQDTMHETTLSEASVGTHDASHVVKSKTGLASVLSLMEPSKTLSYTTKGST